MAWRDHGSRSQYLKHYEWSIKAESSRPCEFRNIDEPFSKLYIATSKLLKGARTASESTTPRRPSRCRHMEAIREWITCGCEIFCQNGTHYIYYQQLLSKDDNLTGSYKRYKEDTNVFTTWLSNELRITRLDSINIISFIRFIHTSHSPSHFHLYTPQ
jgi:hypothetical protein